MTENVGNEIEVYQDSSLAIVDEAEDSAMQASLMLPGYDAVNDQKVLKSVKDVFKGFDYDAGGSVFASADDMAVYMENTMESIRDVRKKADTWHILQKAAAMARFWYLGDTLDKTLQRSDYGTAAISRLAACLKKSQTYIYQIRAVATRLTAVDCYLLGIRGVETSHLRKLAQIKDDDTRHAILQAFIDGYSDTADPESAEKAKRQFIAALNASQKVNAIDVTTTDPSGEDGVDDDMAPEAAAAVKELNKMQKWADRLGGNEMDKFCTTMGSFFVSDSVPDAEDRLAAIKELATGVKQSLLIAIDNIRNVISEIDSLDGCVVVKSGE